MAYDFGSQSLGIQNPFKTEGKIRLLASFIIAGLAFIPLLSIADTLKVDPAKAWGQAILGLFILTWGMKNIASSAMQLFRFYVGRSVPSSLAYNLSESESENAQVERKTGSLRYSSQELESMLMGRKNITFTEPTGWFSRFIHSLIPKLILAPYPLRNFAQEISGVLASTVIALVAYGISSFVVATGLAGDAGAIISPVLSFLLLLYLVIIWRSAAKNLLAKNNTGLKQKSVTGLSFLIVFAIVAPIAIGFGFSMLQDAWSDGASSAEIAEGLNIINSLFAFSAWSNLALMLVLSVIVLTPIFIMIRERLNKVGKRTSVSEYRDNMQESVHPNEIFINIENIVLANRRYKEIPNRVYRNFEPKLESQAQDKGTFSGQLLIETQPEYKEIEFSPLFKLLRLVSTVIAQVLTVISVGLIMWLFYKSFAAREILAPIFAIKEPQLELIAVVGSTFASLLTLFFAWLTVQFSAQILARFSHLAWAEIQFESLLMWMKTEGTYTESKISTGMAYNDSTRSENVVVRSSITPWILTSRIVSSTYATSGMMNLERQRLVLEMSENPQELNSIVNEIRTFLKGREYIASIDNEKDLSNAQLINQVNRVSRSDDGNNNIAALANQSQEEIAGILAHQKEESEN